MRHDKHYNNAITCFHHNQNILGKDSFLLWTVYFSPGHSVLFHNIVTSWNNEIGQAY
uniref:Uncharacterized protein n=1 Tax=Rhizophora mucronata TaxID=61149 RepID=A0A2P2NRB3_RHIMU